MLTDSAQALIQKIDKLAFQIQTLAAGLQNAAPPGTITPSAQYLAETAIQLRQVSGELNVSMKIIHPSDPGLESQIALLRGLIERDSVLRREYHIQDKFRFVREALESLFASLEEKFNSLSNSENLLKKNTLLENEKIVYVYLYNAKGIVMSSWQNMLTAKVFYEYSVNRPIYLEKSHVESLLKTKKNQSQHAYLTIAILASHILSVDPLTSVARVREGSLHLNKFLELTSNKQTYRMSDQGILTIKQ